MMMREPMPTVVSRVGTRTTSSIGPGRPEDVDRALVLIPSAAPTEAGNGRFDRDRPGSGSVRRPAPAP
ncbi:hypothetical protein KCMC57_up59030 [Kitasatospora sp. CMC57]